jgi:anti-sigma B factor antagonist
MALEIRQREREGIVILDMKGELVVGDAGGMADTVRELAGAGKVRAIANLGDVSYIDSTGLGTLVIGFTTLRKAGGALKLLRLSERSAELLLLTKLATIFESFQDEQDAINSFFPDRKIEKFDILSFVQQQDKKE